MKDDFDKWEQRAKENTDKIMSKEQTSITARVEWLSKRIDLESIPNAKELIAFQIKEAVLEAVNPTIETIEGWSRSMREGHNILLYRIEDEIERLEKLKQR